MKIASNLTKNERKIEEKISLHAVKQPALWVLNSLNLKMFCAQEKSKS